MGVGSSMAVGGRVTPGAGVSVVLGVGLGVALTKTGSTAVAVGIAVGADIEGGAIAKAAKPRQ